MKVPAFITSRECQEMLSTAIGQRTPEMVRAAWYAQWSENCRYWMAALERLSKIASTPEELLLTCRERIDACKAEMARL